jgi:hypothetical protein
MRRESQVWAVLDHRNIAPLLAYTEGNDTFGPLGAFISPVSNPTSDWYDLTFLQWYKNGDAGQFLAVNGRKMSVLDRSKLVCILRSAGLLALNRL